MSGLLEAPAASPRVLAQAVGFIPLVLSFFVFLFHERRRVIAVKAASDLLWALHFFLFGEFVGGAINGINAVRGLVFSQKGKKWASHVSVPLFFAALTVIAALVRWEAPYSVLPMAGSLLALAGFWCSSTKNIRKFNFPAVTLWLIYGVIVGSLSTVIANLLSLASIVITEIRSRKAEKLNRA